MTLRWYAQCCRSMIGTRISAYGSITVNWPSTPATRRRPAREIAGVELDVGGDVQLLDAALDAERDGRAVLGPRQRPAVAAPRSEFAADAHDALDVVPP